jgi:hypothetical protein
MNEKLNSVIKANLSPEKVDAAPVVKKFIVSDEQKNVIDHLVFESMMNETALN